jgi:hypothetical protein
LLIVSDLMILLIFMNFILLMDEKVDDLQSSEISFCNIESIYNMKQTNFKLILIRIIVIIYFLVSLIF